MRPSVAKTSNDSRNTIDVSAVQQHLDKVLQSNVFTRSDRMKRFLRFIVEQTLKGEKETLKEYSIAVAVFDKPDDFDPRLDPIVRVEAGRLRSKLREYYMTEGQGDPMWFRCPKRSYIPIFEVQQAPSANELPAPGSLSSPGPKALFSEIGSSIVKAPRAEALCRSPSIAVLPFVALGGRRDLECFCDGMTEEIINRLSLVGELEVAARTSIMQFKSSARDVRQIGIQLGVGVVLEGSVRKAGKRLRVTGQLINVLDGYHLWSASYDKEWNDVLSVQEDISQAIVKALKLHLADGSRRPALQESTRRPVAYPLYLKGRYSWNKRSEEGLRKAIGYFERAIALDPRYALAYTGLADCYAALVDWGALAPAEGWPKAAGAAQKALEIDERLSQAHVLLGTIKAHFEWDWVGAEESFQRAIELNPLNASAHQSYAVCCLAPQRRLELALVEVKRACELDPLWPAVRSRLAWVLYLRRQFGEALDQWQRTIELDPTFYLAYWYQGSAYEQLNRLDEALAAFKQAQLLSRGMPLTTSALGRCFALMGRRQEALEALTRLLDLSKRRYVCPFDVASLYEGLGEVDASFEWLDKAREDRSSRLVCVKVDPAWDRLKLDPRFITLLFKLSLVN